MNAFTLHFPHADVEIHLLHFHSLSFAMSTGCLPLLCSEFSSGTYYLMGFWWKASNRKVRSLVNKSWKRQKWSREGKSFRLLGILFLFSLPLHQFKSKKFDKMMKVLFPAQRRKLLVLRWWKLFPTVTSNIFNYFQAHFSLTGLAAASSRGQWNCQTNFADKLPIVIGAFRWFNVHNTLD